MNFSSYVEFLRKIVAFIPFNIFDCVVLLTMAFYVFEDASFGIIPASISLASTLSSFFIGLVLYPHLSRVLVDSFSLTKGIADAGSFLLVVVVSFVIISILLSLVRKRYMLVTFPKKVDVIGGAIFGFLSFFFIASFAVAILMSFPVSEVIKDSIRNSVTGKFLFAKTQGLEGKVRNIFGGAIEDTINFLTIKPGSNESLSLNFKTTSYKVDEKSEAAMLRLVNLERRKIGLTDLVPDEELTVVARAHAADMLSRGYFSHYTPEGLTPFDRLEKAGIFYQYAGENLAFAPAVEIAMDGLMKSQGHKENILSPNFNKAGIGILDAGIYGKMFVQEFTD